MARSVLLLLAGAIAGSAAVYLLEPSASRPSGADAPTLREPVVPAAPPNAEPDSAAAGGFAAERLAIYQQAAQATDAFDIEALVERALDEPASRSRDLKLTALLARLAEIDPSRAIEFARSRYLEPAFIVPLFEIWAASDPDAAIDELALITPPARQREIALAILGVIGSDADSVERVAAALPAADRLSFETDALLARAELDPAGALSELLAMPNGYRRSILLPRIAELAARTDPRAALAQAAAIGEYALRRSFRDAVLSAWAGLDPEAVFAWLETAEIRDLPESAAVYQALAGGDADRLFGILDGLPPAIRNNAQRAAIQALAQSDPLLALARLDATPPGQDRDRLLQTIAQAYGRQNPDQALAWVRSLPPAQAQTTLRNVLQGIMAVDPDRAVEIVFAELESPAGGRTPTSAALLSSSLSLLLTMNASSAGSAAGSDFGRVADRLLATNNPQVRNMLSSTIGTWARLDPDAALSWALGNVDRIDASAFEQMARGLAQTNPERALSQLDLLPPAQRPAWVTGVAQQLAQSNPDRALELVRQYRGQPEYAGAYGAVAQRMAQTDPVGAAALLREAPAGTSAQSMSAYSMVAREWSRTDPAAAADWALGLSELNIQRQALAQVAQGWAERDLAGAESWVRNVNSGTQRDTALDGIVSVAAQAGRFQPQLLDAYSTPQAAQRGAANAIRTIGRNNVPEARRLLDAHITDPTLRQQLDEYLARTGGTGSGSTLPSLGGIIF